jgi:class 3 adenylate cyclase
MQVETDVTDLLPTVRLPTLVLSKPHSRDQCGYVADRIPGATHVVLPGVGLALHENDAGVEAIEAFLRDEAPPEVPTTVLATVLFTDLVGSTKVAAELGDSRWRGLLQKHHALVRRELSRFGGVEIDTAGDGFFASFDGPARAIACARAIVDGVPALGLSVRAGIHTGECERVGEKLAGLAVSIGARVSSAAGPGEVVVSGTVRDLVAGSGFSFEDLGERELKGVPGSWRLLRVAA